MSINVTEIGGGHIFSFFPNIMLNTILTLLRSAMMTAN